MKLALVLLAACAAKPEPPGTVYFVDDGLVRWSGSRERFDFDTPIFPSRYALPDGRLVGIASTGTGAADSEQLVLIGSQIERIGFTAAQVREPAVVGNSIVFEAKRSADSQLYRLDNAITQLTFDPEGNFAPATLSSNAVVFSSSRDGNAEIYRADIDGTHVQRLTAFHRDDWSPTASGNTIAFVSDREGPPHIFLVDADGSNLRRLTTGDAEEDAPIWSPDGTQLAYESGGAIHIGDRIVRGRDAAFSPDGTWLAFVRDDHIWLTPLAGGDPVDLGPGHLPRWR